MPDEQPPEAAIIDLDEARVKYRGAPLKTSHSGHCGHWIAAIDGDKRRLTCEKCGADLDPFDFLMSLSNHYERYAVPLARTQRKLAEVSDRLDDVKRQERNARARLKRVQEKINALLDAVGQ